MNGPMFSSPQTQQCCSCFTANPTQLGRPDMEQNIAHSMIVPEFVAWLSHLYGMISTKVALETWLYVSTCAATRRSDMWSTRHFKRIRVMARISYRIPSFGQVLQIWQSYRGISYSNKVLTSSTMICRAKHIWYMQFLLLSLPIKEISYYNHHEYSNSVCRDRTGATNQKQGFVILVVYHGL